MNTCNFFRTNVSIGAGVGRKEKAGSLISLLNESKIEYKEFMIQNDYTSNNHHLDTNAVVRYLKIKQGE